jgi:hypothetical protein
MEVKLVLTRFDTEFNYLHYIDEFEDQEEWQDELLVRLIPDSNYNCIGYFDEPIKGSGLDTNKELSDCEIIEVVTKISINVNSIRELITQAGYRLLDIVYGPDRFHFFIQKIK